MKLINCMYAVWQKVNRKRIEQLDIYECKPYVAMFHNVVSKNNDVNDNYTCTVEALEHYIEKSISNGFEFISVDELVKNGVKNHQRIITFDDGFESVYQEVNHLFSKYNVPYVVYITATFIDTPGYLTSHQIKELFENPLCTIGMHANEHIKFREKSPKELNDDFHLCKTKIEGIIKSDTRHYAFPYGSFLAVSKKNINVIKKNVSSIMLTTPKMLSSQKNDVYSLPRINLPRYIKENQ